MTHEIIGKSTYCNGKIYVPKSVKRKIGIKDKDTIWWYKNIKGEIIISSKSEAESVYPY